MDVLTNSQASTYRRCAREHHYRYNLGRRPRRTTGPMDFGTAFHVGLEAWMGAFAERPLLALAQPLGALDDAIMAMREHFYERAEEVELNEFDLVRAEELMRGYHVRWAPVMAFDYDVLGVEQEFRCRLRNPGSGHPSRTWASGGKLDAIVRNRHTGRVWIVEHKTTTTDVSPGSSYWERLRIDGQISTYYDGAMSLGHDVYGCLYDVTKRPGLRPRQATRGDAQHWLKPKVCKAHKEAGKERGLRVADILIVPGCADCEPSRLKKGQRLEDETLDEFRLRVREAIAGDPNGYYQHGEVTRTSSDLDDYRADIWLVAKSVRESKRLGAHPRNPDACVRFNRLCAYYDVCTGAASIDDDALFRQSRRVHEELSQLDLAS